MFLTEELTHDRYLVDTGSTLSIIPFQSNSKPSGPLLKGANDFIIPIWGFVSKTVQFQGKLFTSQFMQSVIAGHILGIIFWRKLKSLIAPETSQVLFACEAATPVAATCSLLSSSQHLAGTPTPLADHCFPRLPTLLAQNLQVKSFQSVNQGSQFFFGPLPVFEPPAVLQIPQSLPADIRPSLQSSPLFSTELTRCPILSMEWSTTFTPVVIPQFLQKSSALTWKN
jgi:hypothetical protein